MFDNSVCEVNDINTAEDDDNGDEDYFGGVFYTFSIF